MKHYFTNEEINHNVVRTETDINNQPFIFYTDNGVFSKRGLDYGTRLLLKNIDMNSNFGKVLDLGCGYGPIGIYIAKNTNAQVHMVDVNINALELCKQNARENGVSRVEIYQSDAYENITNTFDLIVTNPPIRAGKKVVYDFLFTASKYLNKNGKLIFVMRKDHGVKTAIKDLSEKYLVEILDKDKGFYIVEVHNNC